MNLNIKFICLIYVTPYKQSLPIILYNILLVPTFFTTICHIRSDVDFSTCGSMLAFRLFWIPEHFGLWISN